MKSRVLAFCFLFIVSNCFSQVYIKVINKKGDPIQWVSVMWNSNSGLVTDNNGTVTIPAFTEIADSIAISSIGYSELTLAKSLLSEKKLNTISLEESFTEMPTVVAGKKWKPTVLGCLKKGKGMCVVINPKNRSMERGIKISGFPAPVLLKDFSVFIADQSIGIVPFRVKIYNSRNGHPFKSLINENIIVSHYNPGKWKTIDLSDFDIYISDQSFFIGIEWLTTNNNDSKLAVGAHKWTDEKIEYVRVGNGGFGMTFSKRCIPMMRVTLLN